MKNLLQYSSSEMYSSTQLIRKSKIIFDKIQNNEIEKAVILRDGKPSFIMMDFEKYEKLINHFINLDENRILKNDLEIEKIEEIKNIVKSDLKESIAKQSNKNETKIEKSDILSKLDSIEGIINNDVNTKADNMKEFWE